MNTATTRTRQSALPTGRPPDWKWLSGRLQDDTPLPTVPVVSSNWGWLSARLPSTKFRRAGDHAASLYWFPGGVPVGRSRLLASSRIGRRPQLKSDLFNALRTIGCRWDADQYFLITHDGLATHPYVFRLAQLFHLPLVEFRPLPSRISEPWLRGQVESCRHQTHPGAWRSELCYYRLPAQQRSLQRDKLMMQVADSVYLLAVNGRGNCFRAAITRLEHEPRHTRLLINRQLTSARTAKALCDAGALRWWLYQRNQESGECSQHPPFTRILTLSEFARSHRLSAYLFHWTRDCDGPWPDQTEVQYIDDLIFDRPTSDHSRLAALCRIVTMRRLQGTNRITRDRTRVVCFTEQSIDRFAKMRKFRSHLGRWDFELAGVAIQRKVLEKYGARPVIYGSDDTWHSLPDKDRPFFQRKLSSGSATDIDWTEEKEWRVPGDVDLEKFGPEHAFVFVETENEAREVASVSRWPVVVLAPQSPAECPD